MPPGPLHNFGLGPNQRRNTFENNQDGYAGRSAKMRHDPNPMYPPDLPGEAAGENGRVWKIYRDRVNDIDDELLQGWDDALTTLLVFAGLFSAACTAFLIEVSKSLQPDWQRATSLAVFAIYVHLNSTSPPPFEVPNPLSFSPSLDARWVNGLWFTSLTLSLVVSLLAILAKQWLNEYKSRMRKPASSPKAWALRHSVFKGGLERWGVDAMISTLPLLLHAALFLFLIGLCIMLLPLDDRVAGAVIGISGAVSVFYVAAGVTPVFWSDCPSATPALRYAYSLWNSVVYPAVFWVLFSVALLLGLVPLFLLLFYDFYSSSTLNTGLARLWQAIRISFCSNPGLAEFIFDMLRYHSGTAKPKLDEAKIFAKDQLLHEASVLAWMIRMLPAHDDVSSALYVVGILSAEPLFHRSEDNPLCHEDLQRLAEDALNDTIIRRDSSEIDDAIIAIFLRACITVSRRAPQLSEPVRSFLQEAMSRNALELDRIIILTLYGSDGSLVLPIILEGRSFTGVHVWEIVRLAILASSICQPPFLPSAVTAFNDSVRHALGEPSPPTITDPKLLFIVTSDYLLCSLPIIDRWVPLGSALISACSAAARDLFSDPQFPPLPPNFQEHLRFVSDNRFLDCDLLAADLSTIAALPLRTGHHIPPLALDHILYHFLRGQLPIGVDELNWIRAAFQLPPVASDLMDTLSVFPFTDDALHTSRLILLGPVQSTDWDVTTPETTELVAEMAYAYTVLLLALHRSGHVGLAQDMLHKLLPRNRCAPIIARGTQARYHLALHAKIIDSSWWGELRDELVSHGEWTSHPPLVHPDVSSFIEAVEVSNDCLECVADDVAPPLPLVPPPADVGAATGNTPEGVGAATGEAPESVGAVPQIPVTIGALAGDTPEDPATVPRAPIGDPVVIGGAGARTWDAREATFP